MSSGPIVRKHGRVEVRLDEPQVAALRSVFGELRELLLADDDPNLRRLYPTAYPDDPEHEEEYRRLMRDDLLAGKLEAIDVVESALDTGELNGDEAFFAWMGSLNDVRLVLGTRLAVTGDEDTGPSEPQEAMAWAVFQFLGYLLECTVGIAPLD